MGKCAFANDVAASLFVRRILRNSDPRSTPSIIAGMILTVTPNPCVDKTVFVDRLEVGTFMHPEKYTCIPGGKGTNASRVIKNLGRPTKVIVVVGGHTGAHVVDMIRNQDGNECVPVWVESPTRTITTILEEPRLPQTAFYEPGSRVTNEERAKLAETVKHALGDSKVVTFNGSVSDPNIKEIYRDLIPVAKAAGAITILDSEGPAFPLGVEAIPHMVKPNVEEAEEVVGFVLDSDAARWRAIDFFHEKGIELVALSLGHEGALVSRGGERLRVMPPPIREINPVGSGDCMLAGYAIGLLEEMPLEEMAVLAAAAGAANAMVWDVANLTQADIDKLTPQITVQRL